MAKKILLVGTVNNVAKTIEKELKIVLRALSIFDSVEVYLVESDSTDSTTAILDRQKLVYSNFQYKTLGDLRAIYTNRVDRIAYCRNIYVEYIREFYSTSKWDYVAVADLDGMNLALNSKGVKSSVNTSIEWDGVMANQSFGYYDIYALRAKGWVENDCFEELQKYRTEKLTPLTNERNIHNLIRDYVISDFARHKFIYSKMIKIKRNSNWISVNSAFGGFGIYKPWVFLNFNYEKIQRNYTSSEHVEFHQKTKLVGARYFINPYMINCHVNEYNLNRIKIVRLARFLKNNLANYSLFFLYVSIGPLNWLVNQNLEL